MDLEGEVWLGFPGRWSGQETLWNWYFNPCGEFRWSPEGPGSQIHSPHHHVGAPGIFLDLLRSFQMLKGEWVLKATGSYHTYLSLVKLQSWFLSLQPKTSLWTELQPWLLRLQWKNCSRAENSDDDDDELAYGLKRLQYHSSSLNNTQRQWVFRSLLPVIFNPCGEFRWSPEGPVSQIHSPYLRVGAPRFFSDLLRVLSDAKVRVGCGKLGKLPHLFIPCKTAALVLEFAVEDLPSADMQLWFLCLQWRICPWPEHTDDDDDIIKSANRLPRKHCYQSSEIHCL